MTQLLHLVFVFTPADNPVSKATNSIAKATNSIANWRNLFANGMKSIAKRTNSIAKTCMIQILNYIIFVHQCKYMQGY